jgi:nitroimidazol reductase NimA-like FMN-containing flavoprotein (pyridoxamine 5'-phosphate oxidase superfamily)
MSAATAPPRLELLDDDECLRLLENEPIGRLALSMNALPVVLPVNFVVVDHTIVFASDFGLKVRAAQEETVACLEVDGFDTWTHTGWSVLATGILHEIIDFDRLEEARALPLSPWAARSPHHYLELPIKLLSGRRIVRT